MFTFCLVASPISLCVETSQVQFKFESIQVQVISYYIQYCSPTHSLENKILPELSIQVTSALCFVRHFVTRAYHIIHTA